MPDDLRDSIEDNAGGPRRVQGDEGEVEQHSLRDQIAADRYLSAEASVERTHRGLRFTQFKPPGTV